MAPELSEISYAVALVVSSFVVIGIMLIIAPSTDYNSDPETCSCECFDRRFKGLHFKATNQYRHIYFNMTSNTALIFFWSLLHFALLLSFANRALACLWTTLLAKHESEPGRLRWRILCYGSVNLYGLVYGWWVMFNYINDAQHWSDMGDLWLTQLFFSLTDLVPAYVIYGLLATGSTPSGKVLQCALSVSLAHILLSMWEQGAVHILQRHPLASRDTMFLISDVAGVLAVVPYSQLMLLRGVKSVGFGVVLLSTVYVTLKTCVNGS